MDIVGVHALVVDGQHGAAGARRFRRVALLAWAARNQATNNGDELLPLSETPTKRPTTRANPSEPGQQALARR